MAETDILNAHPVWDPDLDDNISPDYGFGNKSANVRVSAKAPGGRPYTRVVSNDGHTFQLTWTNRSYRCVQRIQTYRNTYEDGYFTIIDHDGGGRHYVGRFTGDLTVVQAGNDSYDIRDLAFEEVPGAPMLQYPSDWTRDSVPLKAFNDFSVQQPSTTGGWQKGTAAHGFTPLVNTAGANGDTLTVEYHGYGFQLWMLMGPEFGQISVALDGVTLPPATVDLYNATDISPQMVFHWPSVPVDIHRVTMTTLGTSNSSATGTAATFLKLQVMK